MQNNCSLFSLIVIFFPVLVLILLTRTLLKFYSHKLQFFQFQSASMAVVNFTPAARILDASCRASNDKIDPQISGSPREVFIQDAGVSHWFKMEEIPDDQRKALGKMWRIFRREATAFRCESNEQLHWALPPAGNLPLVTAILDHSKAQNAPQQGNLPNLPMYFKIWTSQLNPQNDFLQGALVEGWVPATSLWQNNKQLVEAWLAQHCMGTRLSGYIW